MALNLEDKKALVAEVAARSEEHTSELQSRGHLVCRLLLEKKKMIFLPTPRALILSRATNIVQLTMIAVFLALALALMMPPSADSIGAHAHLRQTTGTAVVA